MIKRFFPALLQVFCLGCATYSSQYGTQTERKAPSQEQAKEVVHTFYLIGDAGLSPMGGLNPALLHFKNRLDAAPRASTAIFLGDNIYLPDCRIRRIPPRPILLPRTIWMPNWRPWTTLRGDLSSFPVTMIGITMA